MPRTDSLADTPAEDAIPILLDAYGDRLFAVARRLTGADADAHDLVQETFLRAFQKWEQFEGRADPGTWLHTIMVRIASRRWSKRRTRDAVAKMVPFGDRVLDVDTKNDGPVESSLRAEARAVVERAIVDLPPELRLPVVLREIAELSHAQVAEILGLKEATVRVRVHRGRLALREALLSEMPTRVPPPAEASRRLCLDLLAAKQSALDHGVEFVFAGGPLCERCKSVFADLDLTTEACRSLITERLPEPLRRRLEEDLTRTRGRVAAS